MPPALARGPLALGVDHCSSFVPPGHLHATQLLLLCSHSRTVPPLLLPGGCAHHLGVRAGPEPLVCSGSGTGLFPSSPKPRPCWDFCFPQRSRELDGAWLGTSSPRRVSIIPGAQQALGPHPLPRYWGHKGTPLLPGLHQLAPMLRNKCSGQPQTEKSFYWYHT